MLYYAVHKFQDLKFNSNYVGGTEIYSLENIKGHEYDISYF